MAAFVQQAINTKDTATTMAISLGSAPGASNILWGFFGTSGAGSDITGITGATWSRVTGGATNAGIELWIGTSPTSTTQLISIPSLNIRGNVAEFSGVSSTLDGTALHHAGTSIASPLGDCVGGTRTTTNASDLLVACISANSGNPTAWNALSAGGFTALTQESPTANPQMQPAYRIVTSTGTYGVTYNNVAGSGLGFDDCIAAYQSAVTLDEEFQTSYRPQPIRQVIRMVM